MKLKFEPKDIENTELYKFKSSIEAKYSVSLANYDELWRWSVDNSAQFWSEFFDFSGIVSDKGIKTLSNPDNIEQAKFFEDTKLNFAENLLQRRDDEIAIFFKGEDKVEQSITFKKLYEQVSKTAQAMKDMGIEKGDRVAGLMPNMIETIIFMLASSSIGAIWSSASPDFGVQGVLDRFGQIEPKILFTVDGYYYNGKEIDCLDKVREISKKIPNLQKTVIVSYLGNRNIIDIDNAVYLSEFTVDFKEKAIEFARLEFNHPLYIMFSSGTTGVPKCIVHGAGGTLIQHLKEHILQCDVKENDRVFYFTTCGWMMWNWLVSALAVKASLLLYDGSPFYPDGNVLFEFTAKHKASLFGTSAKYIDALKKEEYKPKDNFDLSSIKMITSTGSPLVHEAFDYIYDNIKSDIHIASISGGTDIVSCFVLGNPISPVYRGEIQGAGLGLDVDIFDHDGKTIKGEAGELVCKSAFPSMPIYFWNDKDRAKYHKAYFAKFDNIWCHGDWTEWTENGGLIIKGRSDATLNPGGVRIGTAEIYRQVEKLPEVKESIAVGQEWDGDVRVVLFVILSNNQTLTDELIAKIRKTIREGASPRHMPAKVIQVTDIPRTKSGKITEIAVKDIIHNRKIHNVEALANPEALDEYQGLEELRA